MAELVNRCPANDEPSQDGKRQWRISYDQQKEASCLSALQSCVLGGASQLSCTRFRGGES